MCQLTRDELTILPHLLAHFKTIWSEATYSGTQYKLCPNWLTRYFLVIHFLGNFLTFLIAFVVGQYELILILDRPTPNYNRIIDLFICLNLYPRLVILTFTLLLPVFICKYLGSHENFPMTIIVKSSICFFLNFFSSQVP